MISAYSNEKLITETKLLAQKERAITTQILECLSEIEDRRLFALRGYPSLWEFCTQELKYSDSAAQRRISAMRLIKKAPEAKTKIESGSLSLSTASQVHQVVRTLKKEGEEVTPQKISNLLTSVEGLSSRKAEKKLLEIEPSLQKNLSHTYEKFRALTPTSELVQFVMDEELKNLLTQVKQKLSHVDPNPSTQILLKMMCRKILGLGARPSAPKLNKENLPKLNTVTHPLVSNRTSDVSGSSPRTNRHIPVHIKYQVYKKYGQTCQYKDSKTGKQCNSIHRIQLHHQVPYRVDRTHDAENLIPYCQTHNLLIG